MRAEFFEQAARMDNLLVLSKEQAAATAAHLRRLGTLERELAARDAAVVSWLEAELRWSDEKDALTAENARLRDENAVLSGRVEGMREMHRLREALKRVTYATPYNSAANRIANEALEGGADG